MPTPYYTPQPPSELELDPEFVQAALRARNILQNQDRDPQVQLAAYEVPVFLQTRPDLEQRQAGGCLNCTYLGLWTDHWPGYGKPDHGLVFLFEDGIKARATQGNLETQTFETLRHEIDHALQRDHVLEKLQHIQARGWTVRQWIAVRGSALADTQPYLYVPAPCPGETRGLAHPSGGP